MRRTCSIYVRDIAARTCMIMTWHVQVAPGEQQFAKKLGFWISIQLLQTLASSLRGPAPLVKLQKICQVTSGCCCKTWKKYLTATTSQSIDIEKVRGPTESLLKASKHRRFVTSWNEIALLLAFLAFPSCYQDTGRVELTLLTSGSDRHLWWLGVVPELKIHSDHSKAQVKTIIIIYNLTYIHTYMHKYICTRTRNHMESQTYHSNGWTPTFPATNISSWHPEASRWKPPFGQSGTRTSWQRSETSNNSMFKILIEKAELYEMMMIFELKAPGCSKTSCMQPWIFVSHRTRYTSEVQHVTFQVDTTLTPELRVSTAMKRTGRRARLTCRLRRNDGFPW